MEPNIAVNIFYYNCGNKFDLDLLNKYMIDCNGSIIFANGEECIIYEFSNGLFVMKKRINANLQKRQKKGGQSAQRIARLAEETRDVYVTKVTDFLNSMNREQRFIIYGSSEIKKMIIEKPKHIKLEDGGFLDFNIRTIHRDIETYINALKGVKKYDKYYDEVILYLNTNIDMLDFDIEKKSEMKYYLGLDGIPIPNIGTLHAFTYIGVKYYANENM